MKEQWMDKRNLRKNLKPIFDVWVGMKRHGDIRAEILWRALEAMCCEYDIKPYDYTDFKFFGPLHQPRIYDFPKGTDAADETTPMEPPSRT